LLQLEDFPENRLIPLFGREEMLFLGEGINLELNGKVGVSASAFSSSSSIKGVLERMNKNVTERSFLKGMILLVKSWNYLENVFILFLKDIKQI
jgi:hypothetical protein